MKIKAYLMFLYGVLLLVGGWIGHVKAGSNASFVAGVLTAVVAILSGVGMMKKKFMALGIAIALATALTLFFAYRFSLTQALMPAGMMALISFVVWAVLLFKKN